MRLIVLLGLTGIVACSAATINAGQPGDSNEFAPFRGQWAAVSSTIDGVDALKQNPNLKKLIWEFRDGTYIQKTSADGVISEYGYKVYPDRNPKEFDAWYLGKDQKLKQLSEGGKVIKGIYDFENGKLKRCYGNPGSDRPKTFSAGPGSTRILVTLERVKSE